MDARLVSYTEKKNSSTAALKGAVVKLTPGGGPKFVKASLEQTT